MSEEVLEHEGEDGKETEVLGPLALADSGVLGILQKSEIDLQIATAKRYPRHITRLLNTAGTLATVDSETADSCIYALPRGGKVIEGPSVRFAEIMAYAWGNNRCGARVIDEGEEFVTAMGTYFDLETNFQVAFEVKRRIVNSKGVRYNADMIGTTSNAACAIALRNAILRGIPRAIWNKVYLQARRAVAGDIKTLDSRRLAAMKQFELMGVKREAIFAKLEVKGLEDISLDHMVVLIGIFNAIRAGDMTPEQAFAPEPKPDEALATKSKGNLESIKQRYAKKAQPAELAEKPEENGANQTETAEAKPESGGNQASSDEVPAGPTDAPPAPAAPSEMQEPGATASATAGPREPEVHGATSGSGPVEGGLPGIFDEPAKGTTTKKR